MNLELFVKYKFVSIPLVVVLVLIALVYLPFALSPFQKPIIKPFLNSEPLILNPLNHFRQSLNNCGSYAVAGVVNVFSDQLADPEVIANSISFKVQDRFTLPVGLENYLKDKNMNIENNNAIGLNKIQKIEYLKYQLSQGKAGILLVKIPNSPWYYLHYITLLGYDQSNFYVYDSLVARDGNSQYTVDLNGDKLGNKSIDAKELIQMWDTGNILNYLKNYNIFVKPDLAKY